MNASYLRVSTDEQRERQTIETQRGEIARYCAREKISSVVEFADDGESGMIPFDRRIQSRKLLEAARQGKVSDLLVYRLDRLGRDNIDTLSTLAKLLKFGVRVISVKEGLVENNAQGRLKTGVHCLFAAYERESIVERSKDGSLRLAKEGAWLGGRPPYGYRLKAGDRRESRRLELSEQPIPGGGLWSEVKVVQRIYRMAAEGKSCYGIAEDLTRLGIPPAGRRSAIWRPSLIRNLIISTTYKGAHAWGKTSRDPEKWATPKKKRPFDEDGGKHRKSTSSDKRITRPCPAIVDEPVWKAANATLHRNVIAAMAHAKNDYLLRGLIRCGVCGLTYSGATTTRPSGKKAIYYRCAGNQRAHVLYGGEEARRCPSSGIRAEALEAAVWADVAGFLLRPGSVIRQLEERMNAGGGEAERVSEEIRGLEAALTQKHNARQIALRQLTRENITEADYDREIHSIDREASAIDARLSELRKRSADQDTSARDLRAAQSWLERYQEKTRGKPTFKQRREAVEALVGVGGITITPIEDQQNPDVRVRYQFSPDAKRTTDHWKENQALDGKLRASTNSA